jgi:hypothetical protein
MASESSLIDPAALARRTHGDHRMQLEVLALFVAEAERLMQQVEDAEDPQVRGDRLRALSGLARNTGAVRLAEEVRAFEMRSIEEGADLGPLREVLAQTLAYVRSTGA